MQSFVVEKLYSSAGWSWLRSANDGVRERGCMYSQAILRFWNLFAIGVDHQVRLCRRHQELEERRERPFLFFLQGDSCAWEQYESDWCYIDRLVDTWHVGLPGGWAHGQLLRLRTQQVKFDKIIMFPQTCAFSSEGKPIDMASFQHQLSHTLTVTIASIAGPRKEEMVLQQQRHRLWGSNWPGPWDDFVQHSGVNSSIPVTWVFGCFLVPKCHG